MRNSGSNKTEGNIVVFEGLGIYSSDSVRDKKINEELKNS